MKFNKLASKIKLSSALIAATTVVGGGILSVPLLLSTNNTNKQIISNNSDYKNLIDQDNNQTTGSSDLSSQPAAIQNFFLNEKTKIYTNNSGESIFAVVTKDNGFDVLYAWGRNDYGQLGIGTASPCALPTLVLNLPSKCKITHIVSSAVSATIVINDTQALIDNTQVWVTGSKSYYELGDPGLANRTTFYNIGLSGITKVKSLHAGTYHRVLAYTSGSVDKIYVWGSNTDGQLGTGDTQPRSTPVDISPILNQKIANWKDGEIFASGTNTAILVDGKLYIWGNNYSGQLGNGKTQINTSTPPTTHVPVGGNIKKYSMNVAHSLAILQNGHLWGWGSGNSGRLGNDNTIDIPTPIRISPLRGGAELTNVTNVLTSYSASFIQIDNKIYSCGYDDYGLLAQGNSITNNKIFSPIILDSSARILNITISPYTLIVKLESGLYMAGSNAYGEFAIANASTSKNSQLVRVTPFGSNPTTKSNNKAYNAAATVVDLKNNAGNASQIKTTLAKYVDSAEDLSDSTLTYKSAPVASADKMKVTMTLNTNISYNDDGAKTYGNYDIPVEISNLGFIDSTLSILKNPNNVNTGTIQEILNPSPGSTPSTQWHTGLIDMDKFPLGTTFTKIINDEVIAGTGSNGIYKGEIVPSKYFYGNEIVTTPEKSFSFQFNGLTRVADSTFASATINPKLNKDNIMIELVPGQEIKSEYLSMFVNSATFPTGAKFIVNDPVINAKNRTYSCVLSIDKYYENGLLKTNGSKSFTFDNFKATQTSTLVFNGLSDDSIHSANIGELLRAADNTNTINKLFDITSFPTNVKFTVSGTPVLNKDTKIYSGKLLATQVYENWNIVLNKEVPFEVSNITIIKNSSVDYFELPSEYNIENIEASLINGSEINLEVLKKLININRFPPNTTFAMGTTNKESANGKYTFEIIPSHHYVDGIAVDNSTTKTSYSVTIQFGVPANLGLIIGSTVGGVVLLGIIISIYAKRYELEIAWWNMKARKYSEL